MLRLAELGNPKLSAYLHWLQVLILYSAVEEIQCLDLGLQWWHLQKYQVFCKFMMLMNSTCDKIWYLFLQSTVCIFLTLKNALPVYSRPHKVFVGIFITQPIRLGGQRRFCPAQTSNQFERRLQEKNFQEDFHFWQTTAGNECGNCDFTLCFLFLFVILLLLDGCN